MGDLEPVVSRDEHGDVLALDSGFAAPLVGGVWYAGLLFTPDAQFERFAPVKDGDEARALVAAARMAQAVHRPPWPGLAYASLIEPLRVLAGALDRDRSDPRLEALRLSTVREWARLSSKRYPLSAEWAHLLRELLAEDACRSDLTRSWRPDGRPRNWPGSSHRSRRPAICSIA